MRKKTYLCGHIVPIKSLNMNMKKSFLMLVMTAVASFTISGMISCKEMAKSVIDAVSDSDSVAAASDSVTQESSALPRTLDEAPAPKGKISTMLPAGYLEDGGYKMFILEGDESRFIQDNIGTTDTIYILRLVSYKQIKDEKEKLENGGSSEDIEGELIVDAYDPATKAFVGRFEGTYSSGAEYDENDEILHCGESYAGTFTKADGTKEEFSYFGD